MKPSVFDYRAPSHLGEALELLAHSGENIALLAGGQSLVPKLNLRQVRPAMVLDLNRVPELAGLRITASAVRIGAMTRLRLLEEDDLLRTAMPVLAEAVAQVAHPQIRFRSTLGGSLCEAAPAAQLPPTLMALGARLLLRSAHAERWVETEDFFAPGGGGTARRPDELLATVEIPRRPEMRFCFESVSRRGRAGLPLVGVCLGMRLDGSVVAAARLAASGVADRTLRLTDAEERLPGRRLDDDLTVILDTAAAEAAPVSDLHGSAEYRRQMLKIALRRAVIRHAAEEKRTPRRSQWAAGR